VSGTSLQPLYDLGYSQSALVLGTPYQQYRAAGVNNPTTGPALATPLAWVTTDPGLQGAKPMPYGKPFWYAAIERGGLQLGDYLIGQCGTFFVNSLIYPAPVGLVQCNHTVSLARAVEPLQPGSTGVYSGSEVNIAVPYAEGWPVSLQINGSRMSATSMGLPSDAKLGILLMYAPVTITPPRFNDVVQDENGVRYTVSNVELTPLGYRITVEQWPSG
jgi:hypothetical protein